MYVIYPADELIYMTYGAPLPGIRQRPTLDNLREPRAPLLTSSSNDILPSYDSVRSQRFLDYDPSVSSKISQASDEESASVGPEPRRPATHPRKEKPSTDIFGYSSTPANAFSTISQNKAATSASNDKGKPPGKSKNRLHINLGRLGRLKKEPPPEPARLRELTDFQVSNPMFTRENICARNYDAFFESGVPVYSLQYRSPVTTPSAESDELDNEFEQRARPHTFGFFTRTSKAANKSRNRSSEPASVVAQKGDRCLLTQ